MLCSGVCVDLTSDRENCGRCGTTCSINDACSASSCQCAGIHTYCISVERELTSTAHNTDGIAAYHDASRDWLAYYAPDEVVIYDAANAQQLREIPRTDWEPAMTFLPSEPTLLYLDEGAVYQVEEGEAPAPLALTENLTWFVLSEDGSTLATWDDTTLRVYSYPALVLEDELTASLVVNHARWALGISPEGNMLAIAAGYETNQIEFFDRSGGTSMVLVARGATATYAPTFSSDSTELYVGGGWDDGHVYVFDTALGTELRRFQPFTTYVYSIDLVPGYDQLLVGGYSGTKVIDAQDGTAYWEAGSGAGAIQRVAFSPDGAYLYLAHGQSGDGSGVIIYSTR
jgi:WD40 repeat protein